MIERGEQLLTFRHHEHKWRMKLTRKVVAKVMRDL